MKVKNAIKRIVALGTGAVMLGATVMGAAAYDLGDYPNPIFVDSNGHFNGEIVVGASASNADLLGALDIATSLQRAATQEVSISTTSVSVSDGDAEEIAIGNTVTTNPGLDSTYLDDDLSVLQDTSVDVGSETVNVHDEIQIGSLSVTTSLPSGEEKYGQDVILTAGRDTLTYCYVFDEAVNLSSSVSSSDPLKISFLGQTLDITSVGAADQITAQVGKEVYLESGASTVVAGKTVTFIKAGSSAAVVEVDGTRGTVSTGQTEKINGLRVKLDSVFNEDGIEYDSATLIVGLDTVKSYNNGEPFIGEDEGNPDWVWKLSGLLGTSGQTLCVENDFNRIGPNRDPAGVGEYYSFPNDFVKIGIDSLTLTEDDYMSFDVATESNVELDTYGGGPANAATITLTAGEDESLLIDYEADFNQSAITVDVKTDKIYLELDYTNSRVGIYYADPNDYDRIKNAGNQTLNASDNSVTFGYFEYGKTQGTDIALKLVGDASASDALFLGIVPTTPTNDQLWITLGNDGANFDGFGAPDNQDNGDIRYGNAVPTAATNISGLDEDQRTAYGIELLDPKSGSSSDEYDMRIPKDQLKANVVILPGDSAVAGGVSGTYDKVMPISVGIGVLDTNAQAGLGGSTPYIVVGGPCANDVAAELMGNPENCAEGFVAGEAKIKWYEEQNALLVAGYNPDDTVGASRVVANYDDYSSAFAAGKTEIKVSVPTLNSIQVETV